MKQKHLITSILCIVSLFITLTISGQAASTTDILRQEYINKYTKLAVREMQKSGIPASIIMAQALLESDNGQSELALTANNHFGIKCHTTWTGRRYYYDDDELDDCFRVYRTVGESYRDHSLFLMTRARYLFLFDLDAHDYKAWAKGLKEAGYATNPVYAEMLVNIIESNELYRLDRMISKVAVRNARVRSTKGASALPESIPGIPIHTRNRIKYVIAGQDDTVESLTRELGKLKWEIRKYNEISRRGQLTPGQIVYLQPKRRKASRGFDIHYVKQGESWYSIAQEYGIKLKCLYRMNRVTPGMAVEADQLVYLRGQAPIINDVN